MIVGQEKISNLINTAQLDTFPRTLMLVGPIGSGKHLICNTIANKFGLTTFDITETLSQESIEEIYERVQPYLYLIRINDISIKEENAILKFLEEPLKNSYIILLAETDLGILQTILNRCQIWYLQQYTKSFLQSFLPEGANPSILDVATTPGQVTLLSQYNFEEMVELADKIIDKIHMASIPNTLTLSNRLAFKNEKDKFNVKLFIDILMYRIMLRWKTILDIRYVEAYSLTNTLYKNMYIKNADQKLLFEKYLIELRAIMKGCLV